MERREEAKPETRALLALLAAIIIRVLREKRATA
jgi:hypothetical protein